jgi:hypothetical protein
VNGVAPTAPPRQAGAGGILIGIDPKPCRAGLTFSGHPPGLGGKPSCHRSKGTTCPHPARSLQRRFLVGVSLSRSQRTVHASLMRTVRFRKPGWRGLSWFFGWCPDWHLGSVRRSGERPRALEKPTRGKSSYRITSAAISASASAQKKLEQPGESMFTSGLKRHPIGSGFS